MAGLTPEGLVIKRYSQILADKKALAVQRFLDLVGPDDNVDTSDSSTLGRLIALSTPGEADLWEAIQEVYDSFNPNSATGLALDNLVALGGIQRFGETQSIANVVLKGDAGVLIPDQSVVKSDTTNERFDIVGGVGLDPDSASGVDIRITTVASSVDYTVSFSSSIGSVVVTYTSDVSATESSVLEGLRAEIAANYPTITASVVDSRLVLVATTLFQEGEWIVSSNMGITKVVKIGTVRAENYGPIEQETNTITTISTPVLGWDSVYNPSPAVVGRFEETDEELRLRFNNSKYERASNILEALYSALIGIEDIQEVKIYENDTDVTDGNGVPAHSFMPVILGGDSSEIAQTIWENKPLGIRSFGNTSVTIFDSQSFPHAIGFERPSPIPIYVEMTLTTNSEFPADGNNQIKQALIDYITSLSIGESVVYSRLYTPINSIPGHQVDTLTLGLSASPVGTSNIPISFNEIASIGSGNIVINT
tara:strand:+ start:38992 stop:40431 length:1440 start_codon:yes stop_codon:yes gene_type:complete